MSYRKKHLKPKLKKLRLKKIFYKKPLFWVILLLIAICWTVYFVLFSKTVQITAIEITGNEKVSANDIEDFIRDEAERQFFNWGIFHLSSKSIFLADKNQLKESVLRKFPAVQSAEVKKKISSRKISVALKERNFFGVFCQTVSLASEKCFMLDENGIVFEYLENVGQDLFIVRKVADDDKLFPGNLAVEKSMIDAVSAVKNNLETKFQIGVKEALISDYLVFITSEGWKIYFNPNDDIQFQITKMNALLEKEISPQERKKIQYIYLQYKDRAYYK